MLKNRREVPQLFRSIGAVRDSFWSNWSQQEHSPEASDANSWRDNQKLDMLPTHGGCIGN